MSAKIQRDVLGHEAVRHVDRGWPAVMGWRYLDGYSPAEVAGMFSSTPSTVLLAARALGCERLYLLGTRWLDADGNQGPRWDPKRAWDEQWLAAQAVLAEDKKRRSHRSATPPLTLPRQGEGNAGVLADEVAA